MPFISIQTGVALSPEQRAAISRDLAEIITVIPGKNVDNLMLAFHDQTPMVLGGKEQAALLFMEIRLRGAATPEAKKKVTEESFRIFEKNAGVSPANVYINIQELESWGARGSCM